MFWNAIPLARPGRARTIAPVAAPETATVLRGAAVAVDARRVGRVLAVAGLAGLAAAAALLLWAGIRHNDRITRLRQEGVPVTARVTGCRGLMGGSGSNLVGYSCRGSLTLDGRRYEEFLPGTSLRRSGAAVALVAAPGSPPLLATPHEVAGSRPSVGVFIPPAVLLILLVASAGVAVLRARRLSRPPRAGPAGGGRPARAATLLP